MMIKKSFHFFIFLIMLPSVVWAAQKPSSQLCTKLLEVETQERPSHKKLAQNLVELGLADHAYAALWQFKNPAGQGPYAENGEALVVGLKKQDEEKWMNEIGHRSIGFMISGLPEEASSTAFLRIGNKFYSEDRIRYGRGPRNFIKDVLKKFNRSFGYTEATFIMTEAEIKLIQDFIDARGERKIKAQFDVSKKGPFKGSVIKPVWVHSGEDLLEESCAAAVMSFIDEKWLAHYDSKKAAALRKIKEKYNLNWTYVARRLIWENFRNPKASYITLHRIDASEKAEQYVSGFSDSLGWGHIRGLYSYAFIPDNPHTSSDKFESVRISLSDYLKQ